MSKSEKSRSTDREGRSALVTRPRMVTYSRTLEEKWKACFHPCCHIHYSLPDWRFPIGLELEVGERVPLCDMIDKGDKYEIQMEVPGIQRKK